jgi:hypothetical protein
MVHDLSDARKCQLNRQDAKSPRAEFFNATAQGREDAKRFWNVFLATWRLGGSNSLALD